ncbi:MAG: cation-translocating P-type ATPase, partial [Mycobacterium sp.]
MKLPLGSLILRASTLATAPVALGMACTATAVETGLRLGSAPARMTARVASPDQIAATVRAVKELLGGTPARRCWSGPGRSWIEVRGLHGDSGRKVGTEVLRAVRRIPGVRTATLNYPLSRIVVELERPEPTLADLCEAVADAEQRFRPPAERTVFEPPTDLPGDGAVLTGKLIAAAATGIGL